MSGAETIQLDESKLKEIRRKPVVFVLGGPGSGKGTQCSRLAKDFCFLHLCPGDLLRHEAAKDSEQGRRIKSIMKEGGLVPSDITVALLKAAMISNSSSPAGYLIDGFPRDLEVGDKLFKEQVCDCSMVLVFECSEEVMVERLLERGKTSGRVDDNEETIRKRLATYHQQTRPVIEHYQRLDKVENVNGNSSMDAVYQDVEQIVQRLIQQPG